MKAEIEAKFFIGDKAAQRKVLAAAGFTCTVPERLMRRCNFQFTRDFTAGKKWARVRDEGDKVTLSVKEIIDKDRADGTLEVEITIDNFDKGCAVLTACGLFAQSLHENLRETWEKDGVVATIDSWPHLEPVLEIEAESVDQLNAICTMLKLDMNTVFHDPIEFSYARKYNVAMDDVLRLPELRFDIVPDMFKAKAA
jgi:adenylate cyclase class 2